jgi:ABC-type Fe3+ transport system permease subunit
VLVRGRGGVWQAFLNIGRFDRGLLVQTAVLAGSSAMLATLLGGIWVLGASVYGRGIRMKPGLEIRDSLLLLPWLMPGVLLGAICVRFLSSMPGAGWFYPSTFFLAMLLAVRVLFAPAKVLRLMAGTLPRSWFEAWELHQLSKFRLMTQLLLPLLAPAFVIGWAIAYWLILAETGLVVMVAPPGVETLMMRVFHLLHYGYEDEVAAACLWVLVLGLGPFLAGVWALGRIRKARSC